jgi:hypothetical protein
MFIWCQKEQCVNGPDNDSPLIVFDIVPEGTTSFFDVPVEGFIPNRECLQCGSHLAQLQGPRSNLACCQGANIEFVSTVPRQVLHVHYACSPCHS